MKILIISTTDTYGGAAKSAYRLHKSLKSKKIDSKMFVQFKFSDDPDVVKSSYALFGYGRILFDKFLAFLVGDIWSSSVMPSFNVQKILELKPDVIHLHWINNTLSINEIKQLISTKIPIIWTMHDMWAMGGGYHYFDSGKKRSEYNYLERSLFNYKKRLLQSSLVKVTVVTPSNWLADEFRQSQLFGKSDVRAYAGGMNTTTIKPIPNAKEKLGLDKNKKYICFGSVASLRDTRKGSDLLLKALKHIKDPSVELLIFGSDEMNLHIPNKAHFFGNVSSIEKLNQIYSAADVFVAPSRMENLANTVLEAMASGTPVVAFDIGGMPDMINDKTGALAKPFDVKDLAIKIEAVMAKPLLGKSARAFIEKEYDEAKNISLFIKLYEEKMGLVK